MSIAEINTKVALSLLDAFTEGNVDRIVSLLADDATWWAAGSIPGVSGSRTKAEVATAVAGMADLSVTGTLPTTIHRTIAQGDLVAIEASTDARFTNGRAYQNQYMFLIRVRDGEIVEVKEYMDTELARATFLG
ncbi:nuclear transport factor 2 family protein [Streptomyces chartreusis]|uniref:nuclear transport factor 2 family protein n=1 Tax=Streptomyces chartreusis TaxID=1969 RepID=UPI00371A3EC1